jgi:glycosyltransferase involved in cell wall biosynthesis
VRLVTQENRGASAARNRAFDLCQGDYIQWLDADDLLAPDKIAKQMALAQKLECESALLSAPWGTFMYRLAKAQFTPTPLWCDLSPVEWLLRKMGQNLHMQTATWLVSRKLTEVAGPWDTRLSLDDDGEYFCRVLLASKGVCFVRDAMVFYRESGFSRLSNVDRSDKKLESQFLSMKLHVGYLRSLEESDRVRVACLSYLQTWFVWFFGERPDLAESLEELAATLGGQLKIPPLRRKYHWIGTVFGRRIAVRAQSIFPRLKLHLIRSLDKALCMLSSSKAAKRA